MSQTRDSSPVYYREIQKTSYLKRIPDEASTNKLLPLGLKKPPPKPLWTQLCIHNGRTPYLEQYRDPISARAHRPVWRHSLGAARHVTASVTPRENEYDFLIDTDEGAIRMLAPDWQCMQEWVCSLRSALVELRVTRACENVYVSAPPPPAAPPRAPARDPTSPLPALPAPPDRIPGIELTPSTLQSEPVEPIVEPQPQPEENIDISNWDSPSTSLQTTNNHTKKGLAKICGQNVCLDDSIFKRHSDSDSDNDIDSSEFTQTVVVSDGVIDEENSDRQSNVTVIQVSNKEQPHTAIPVTTDVFNFDTKTDFVNVINTENVQNSNEYGTVFDSDYGHLSLTTTVSLTGDVKVTGDREGLYERLCMASTDVSSPLTVKKLNCQRKSSLPNLDNTGSTYEYLFLSDNNNVASTSTANMSNNNSNDRNVSTVTTNSASITTISTSNLTSVSSSSTSITSNSQSISPSNSGSSKPTSTLLNSTPISSTSVIGNTASVSSNTKSVSSNVTSVSTNSTSVPTNITSVSTNMTSVPTNLTSIPTNSTSVSTNMTSVSTNSTSNVLLNGNNSSSRVQVNSVSVNNMNLNTRAIRSSIERSLSQNSCDMQRRDRHNSTKNSKVETAKPIWKRGLTELSLLTRLRGIGQGKRSDSPNRQTNERQVVNSPNKVFHRSRPEIRTEQRRSSSLSNGDQQTSNNALIPLRSRQAMLLREEQRRGAALVATVTRTDPPILCEYNNMVWVARAGGARGARAGDRVAALGAAPLARAAGLHAALRDRLTVDILVHRVPLAKIYVINKRDKETLGIKLDNECNIVSVEADSPAARAGIPPVGKWAVTEVNNRHINLIKGGEEEMNRLSIRGTEALILIQPSAFVKVMRSALKANKNLLSLR